MTTCKGAIAVLGAGLTGSLVALRLAEAGRDVVLYEAETAPLSEASRVNEGKVHLGFVYANDFTRKTATRMIKGALSFREELENWIESSEFERLISQGMDYVVPHDSQRTPEDLRQHFAAVDKIWREQEQATGKAYLGRHRTYGWRPLPPKVYETGNANLLASFETEECAVDSQVIADLLAIAIRQHPRIEFRGQHRVDRVEERTAGWSVIAQHDGQTRVDGPFRQILNATWNDRRRIDHESGFKDKTPWITRYKCNVDFTCPPEFLEHVDLRSFTGVLGAYGDVVLFPTGRVYLSWYPSGLLLAETTLSSAKPVLDDASRRRIFTDAFLQLGQIQPGIKVLQRFASPENVSGGFILARGQTDISDPASELHERHQVGISSPQSGYFSIDTGKYTLGPLLAAECAGLMLGQTAAETGLV